MATAYAAVVTVQHIIEKIQQHHAFHIKSLGENPLIETLRAKVNFLQDFLETHYNSRPVDHDLRTRIANAGHAAEDVLESEIVDRIHAVSSLESYDHEENRSSSQNSSIRNHFDQSLEKVIKDMDLIVEEKLKMKTEVTKDSTTNASVVLTASSSSSALTATGKMNSMKMVGFEKYSTQLLEKLTGQGLNRQVIPIFGMGGIGKTTLARNVYEHPLVMEHFDRRAWVAISQQFSVRKMLLDIMGEIKQLSVSGDSLEDHELGQKLRKELYGRRYLILLDDMWSIDAWYKVKSYFPDTNDGSRIVITTRISNLASQFGSRGLKLDFMDDDESWNLLSKKVFGEERAGNSLDDRVKLEELGRMIAKKCRGLPLSIVTVGGLLTKSHKTTEYWEYVLENLNSIVATDDNEHCLKILSLSYGNLPIHLKPCFLHMGHLPEDYSIPVAILVRLWVAEGFLKPNKAKSLEEVANDYLKDLIDRNLFLFLECESFFKEDRCYMHDLLRDVCLKEAQKDKFLFLVNDVTNIPNIGDSQRRLVIEKKMEDWITDYDAFVHNLELVAPLVRSFSTDDKKVGPPPTSRFLRVLHGNKTRLGCQVFKHINLRYLEFEVANSLKVLPSSLNLFWNLESLIICGASDDEPIVVTVEIWEMPQLKHLELYDAAFLPEPPSCSHYRLVLRNLHTVSCVVNFKLTEEVIWRIPNIKELELDCDAKLEHQLRDHKEDIQCSQNSTCVVRNLDRLVELQSLTLWLAECPHTLGDDNWHQQINFPNYLKKLMLSGSKLLWESICMTKIGLLPHLEQLKLYRDAFKGDEWNPVDGQFVSLRLLEIDHCSLKHWNADETSFPRLERLVLRKIYGLEEIPLGIGEIPTLLSIYVKDCSDGVSNSAKAIQELQESLGNETLRVYFSEDDSEESDDESGDESDDESGDGKADKSQENLSENVEAWNDV